MSLFNTILERLGLATSGAATGAGSPSNSSSAAGSGVATQAASSPSTSAAQNTAQMSQVDVASKLDGLAAKNQEKLNWKTSIVDLMKLLGMDSSIDARKKLATELGCPTQKMSDSAQMNMWLHEEVMQKIAANGGTVPKELLKK